MSNSNLILDHQKIEQKINRIAYQIFEDNYDQKELIMAGIASNGYRLAEILAKKLQSISPIKVKLLELQINKKNPLKSKVEIDLEPKDFKDKSVILVDDVLNSGKTLMYGLQVFLAAPVKNLSVAVLVNRSHKRYPVYADYVGLSLATTLKEHIEVSFDDPKNHTVSLS